jgi:branched-chain amino acid transport system permease protein
MWLQQIEQLAVDGAINGSFYALLGVGFGLILGVTGRFHYAFALVFTFAAYVTSVMESAAGLPVIVAVIAGLLAAAVLGVAIEHMIYRPLALVSGPLSLLTVFISSLGVTIAGVNLITLAWSAQSRSLKLVPVTPLQIGDVTFTTLDLSLVVSAWILIAALAVILSFTDLGRSIRAVRGNPVLSRMMGTDPGHIYLAVFAIGLVRGRRDTQRGALRGVAGHG